MIRMDRNWGTVDGMPYSSSRVEQYLLSYLRKRSKVQAIAAYRSKLLAGTSIGTGFSKSMQKLVTGHCNRIARGQQRHSLAASYNGERVVAERAAPNTRVPGADQGREGRFRKEVKKKGRRGRALREVILARRAWATDAAPTSGRSCVRFL